MTVEGGDQWLTGIETDEFRNQAAKLLSPQAVDALILHLALHPTAGEVIPATGGVRKLRWALQGRGKRGGARVIYFAKMQRGTLYLFTVYGKSAKEDLTEVEKKELRALIARL